MSEQHDNPATKREVANARQQRWRSRKARGQIVFRLSLNEDAVAAAVQSAGLLKDTEALNRALLERALERLVRLQIL
jgi:hypothetical protein